MCLFVHNRQKPLNCLSKTKVFRRRGNHKIRQRRPKPDSSSRGINAKFFHCVANLRSFLFKEQVRKFTKKVLQIKIQKHNKA